VTNFVGYFAIMFFLGITEVPIIVRTVDEAVDLAKEEEVELNVKVREVY